MGLSKETQRRYISIASKLSKGFLTSIKAKYNSKVMDMDDLDDLEWSPKKENKQEDQMRTNILNQL